MAGISVGEGLASEIMSWNTERELRDKASASSIIDRTLYTLGRDLKTKMSNYEIQTSYQMHHFWITTVAFINDVNYRSIVISDQYMWYLPLLPPHCRSDHYWDESFTVIWRLSRLVGHLSWNHSIAQKAPQSQLPYASEVIMIAGQLYWSLLPYLVSQRHLYMLKIMWYKRKGCRCTCTES